jgi:multidrug efflux pump subunit AcrA (membrane-fusion protein)
LGQVVKVDVQDGAALSGKVLAIGAVVEPGRQTVMVRVVLAEANVEALRPGLRVSLRFAGDAGAALWRVPRAALVQVDGALSLFVLRKGKVLPLAVETQGTSEAQPALRAAFVAVDQVAVAGAVLLKGAWDGRGGAAQ